MAAGLGFKTFTTGEVLTAADTNGYLMQGVLVFASSAARSAAVTSPQEGQYSYLKDTDALEFYNGTAWTGAPVGDITGVTAGVGITGGGTSGTVTVTNDMATTITAAGDIVVGTGSGTYDNLPIGTTAQVLTADTTVSPYKVKWAAVPTGSMTLLSTTSLTGATTTISSIDQTYTKLYMIISGVTNATANGDFRIAPNSTTNASSGQVNDGGQNTFTMKLADYMFVTFGTSANNKITFNNANNAFAVTINNYASSTTFKPYSVSGGFHATNAGGVGPALVGGGFNSNTAITSLVFSNSGGNLSTGTVLLYGVK